jgi:hypothetical protein
VRRLVALVALAAAVAWGLTQETVLDEEVRVGPGKIRTLDLGLEANGRVVCEHHVVEGASGVRVVLLKKAEAEKWVKGEAHRTLAGTGFAHDGSFTHRVAAEDEYRLVLDNRMEGRSAALVRLRVTVVTGEGTGPAKGPDRRRGQTAVWASVVMFLVICGGAGWRLRKAWVERVDRELMG